MAKIDFEGKPLQGYQKTQVKDDVYPVECIEILDRVVVTTSIDGKERKRIILKWKMEDEQLLTQFTSVDVKIGVGKFSPTGSYTFLEKAGELENFKKYAGGKEEIPDDDVLNFFKQRFLNRKASVLTKTITSKEGEKYSVIDRFINVEAKL